MSDRDASISDAVFREALDALVAFVRVDERERTRHSGERNGVLIARARVLALYAEAQRQGEHDQLALAEQVAEATVQMEQGRAERQGEEAVVTDGTPDGQYIELRFVQSTRITDGDRVWVTKVEEGQ